MRSFSAEKMGRKIQVAGRPAGQSDCQAHVHNRHNIRPSGKPIQACVSKASQGGTADAFVSKMNADNSYGGTWRFGGTSGDALTGLAVDSSGNLHAGGFQGTGNFARDFGSTVNHTANGAADDGFYVSITPAGSGTLNAVRVLSSSTAVQDRINAVVCDCTGNIYLAGFYQGSINFGQDFSATDNKNSHRYARSICHQTGRRRDLQHNEGIQRQQPEHSGGGVYGFFAQIR